MKDGLYVVTFRSPMSEGAGVVTVKSGAVNGGDFGYVYQGQITPQSGNNATATIEVTRFNHSAESVFGPASNFNLMLKGTTDQESFNLEGSVEGQPSHQIRISGRFFKELV